MLLIFCILPKSWLLLAKMSMILKWSLKKRAFPSCFFFWQVTCQDATRIEKALKPLWGEHHDVSDDIISESVGNIKSKRAVFVVNFPFLLIIKNGIGMIDFLEHFLCFGIVRVFVGMIFQRQSPIPLFDVLLSRIFRQIQKLIQSFARTSEKIIYIVYVFYQSKVSNFLIQYSWNRLIGNRINGKFA